MNSSIKRIGIVQTNLENARTVGYKAIHPDSVLFSDMLKDMFRDGSQGSLMPTDRQLDLALTNPNAFFLVEGAQGPERSRDGHFHFDENGKIVNFEGKELVIVDRTIDTVEEPMHLTDDFDVDKEGKIFVNGKFLGRVVVDFEGKASGEQAHIIQGKLESSNVDVKDNLITMLQVKRHIDTIQGMMAMGLVADKSLVETYGRNV
jgi:flagellar basal-body rod protein FlgG